MRNPRGRAGLPLRHLTMEDVVEVASLSEDIVERTGQEPFQPLNRPNITAFPDRSALKAKLESLEEGGRVELTALMIFGRDDECPSFQAALDQARRVSGGPGDVGYLTGKARSLYRFLPRALDRIA
jgi:hypothetical protein